MKKKISVLGTVILALILAFFSVGSWMNKATFSQSERRKLAVLEPLTVNKVMDGAFQNSLDDYLSDHLPYRSELLSSRSWILKNVFGALDDAGIVLKDGSLIAVEREIHSDSLEHAAKIFSTIMEKDLKSTDCKVYFTIIPDKSYFLEKDEYLNMDYDLFMEEARACFTGMEEIPLTDTLALSDYYFTDPHWKQENLIDTAKRLADSMQVKILEDYSEQTVVEDFMGQTGGRTGLKGQKDEIQVLWNESMKDWSVYRFDTGKPVKSEIYDPAKANGRDPYEVFLGGPAGMLEIENPHGPKDRELVAFTDSFGLSLMPLLASGYSKTTLIDLRNLPHYRLDKVIDFKNQDVLFAYSTSVLNASETIK